MQIFSFTSYHQEIDAEFKARGPKIFPPSYGTGCGDDEFGLYVLCKNPFSEPESDEPLKLRWIEPTHRHGNDGYWMVDSPHDWKIEELITILKGELSSLVGEVESRVRGIVTKDSISEEFNVRSYDPENDPRNKKNINN